MKKVFTFLAAVSFSILILSVSMASAVCNNWDFARDYMRAPDQLQAIYPDTCGDPVWYFMNSGSLTYNPANYTMLNNFTSGSSCIPSSGTPNWHGGSGYPFVVVNHTGADLVCDGILIAKKATANVHPNSNSAAIVGWKSPISGTVKVTVKIVDAHPNAYGNGVDWFVQRESAPSPVLASGVIDDGGTATWTNNDSLIVSQGEFLYFGVGPRGQYYNDSTRLDITITSLNSESCF